MQYQRKQLLCYIIGQHTKARNIPQLVHEYIKCNCPACCNGSIDRQPRRKDYWWLSDEEQAKKLKLKEYRKTTIKDLKKLCKKKKYKGFSKCKNKYELILFIEKKKKKVKIVKKKKKKVKKDVFQEYTSKWIFV